MHNETFNLEPVDIAFDNTRQHGMGALVNAINSKSASHCVMTSNGENTVYARAVTGKSDVKNLSDLNVLTGEGGQTAIAIAGQPLLVGIFATCFWIFLEWLRNFLWEYIY